MKKKCETCEYFVLPEIPNLEPDTFISGTCYVEPMYVMRDKDNPACRHYSLKNKTIPQSLGPQ